MTIFRIRGIEQVERKSNDAFKISIAKVFVSPISGMTNVRT